ncbi:MAG TPA: GNAT family N-acetyltransferase [Pseudolysinimonas sp.]|nr:GNAT family N-acetyltransferase [Pseudolysinimonas sp.]
MSGGPSGVILDERAPTVAELHDLAEAVGWLDHYDWQSIGAGLERSLAGVVALDDGKAAGCARVVGDGVRYFYIQDVLVHPGRTDDGLATRMVERLLGWIERTAPAEAFVGLFSSPDARGVYEGLGFGEPDDMTGMVRFLGSP